MNIILFMLSLVTKAKEKMKTIRNKKEGAVEQPKKTRLSRVLFYLSIMHTFIISLPTLITVGFYLMLTAMGFTLIILVSQWALDIGGGFSLKKEDAVLEELGEGGGQVLFTEAQLSSMGGALTDEEKNFYRLGILAQQAVNGYGGVQYLPDLDKKTNTVFLIGISSTETGMKFYRDGRNENILEIPSDIPLNGSGYGFMGLSPNTHSLNGMTSAQQTDMKGKYTPKLTPTHDINYAPWATYFSMKHLDGKMKESVHKYVGEIEKVFTEWGLNFNDENRTVVTHFMLQAAYHGVQFKEETIPYAHFWAMLLHSTGDSNETRSFNKWKINDSGASYSESSFRKTMFGTNMTWKEAGRLQNPSSLKGIGTKVEVNGTALNEPLWTYLYKKYGTGEHASQFEKAWAKMREFGNIAKGKGDRQLNFHYGFNSFLQGNRVINQLSTKIPSMNNVGTASGAVITAGSFKHEAGVLQAKQIHWKDTTQSTQDFLQKFYSRNRTSLYSSLMPHVGKSGALSNPNHVSRKHELIYNKHGVPFQVQYPYGQEDYQKLKYSGSGVFETVGCGVYSMSYILSAYTRLNVNPPETALYMGATEAMTWDGLSQDSNHGRMITALTGKQAKSTSASSQGGYWALAKEHLDAHRGLVLYRLSGKFASGINHYVVLIDSHDVNGKKMYSMYSSSNLGHTTTLHDGDTLMRSPGNNKRLTLVFD